MLKTFIPPRTDGMIRSSFNIGCSESKVVFKWRKNNNNNIKKSLYRPLQGANFRTSCISQTNTRPVQVSHQTEKPALSLRYGMRRSLRRTFFRPEVLHDLGRYAKKTGDESGVPSQSRPQSLCYHCPDLWCWSKGLQALGTSWVPSRINGALSPTLGSEWAPFLFILSYFKDKWRKGYLK